MSSQFAARPQNPKPKNRLNSAFKQLWSMHWWMAACYLVLFVGGFSMVRSPEGTAIQGNLYTFHKSVGVLTMALLTWRIFVLQRVWWRKYTHRLPKFSPEWIRTFLFHTAIYVFMLAVPLSGFFLTNSYKSNYVPFFWLTTLPDIFPQNSAVLELARSLHFWIAYTFLAFIVLHIIDQKKYVRSLWRRATKTLQKSGQTN
ncbi:cytochrome b [Aerosakkonemataceae cyanobacterium BLCC-F50]|uniref:Cytochrome b n=1 Tax=Floridaenema flaviceps BLCC-F50 TaxID=3153642 RepID=A0ABV4XPS0_9CYAN